MSGESFPPPENDPLISLEEREVPAAEREQIIRQIELALERRRTQVTPELLVVRPRKRGLLLPVLVNLTAAVLVVGGVLLLLWYFRMRQDTIALRAGTYLSAEGRLLETLKKETDQRLRAKDGEIAAIQGQLRELSEQSAALQAGMESELRARERSLRDDMEARLAAERERLASLGTSTNSIDRRLQELERQGQRQLGTEIDSYRRALEAQLAEQEQALRGSRQQAREALEQANRDRRELLEELHRREAGIRAQFEQERESLQTRALAAEEALRSLRQRRQGQELLEDQVTAHYLRALVALEDGRPEESLAGLDALEGLLQGEAIAALPDLADRRDVDKRLVAALRELIRAGGQGQSAATAQEGGQGAQENLQAELDRARGELADQRRQTEVLEARSAGAAMSELQARADRLGTQFSASEERAARLAAQLESARSDKSAAEQALRAARDTAHAGGREAALRDVLRYLRYAGGSAEEKKALEGSLLALVRQDPLYRAVTREIQLGAPAGAGGGRSPYVFLGVVSSVSGGTIVVDPMVELTVGVGALIQVRRASELEREQTIGTGRVLQLRGGKVTAVIDGGAAPPAVRDMVYVESRP